MPEPSTTWGRARSRGALALAAVMLVPAASAVADPVPDPPVESSPVEATYGAAWTAAQRAQEATGAASPVGTMAAVPVPTRPLPAAVDVRPSYVGQASCDPVDKPGAVALGRLMVATYGRGVFGISRACTNGTTEHSEGRAVDWMLEASEPTDRAVAESALAWLTADGGVNARRLGVMYVIWNRRMWRAYAPERGWTRYSGSSPHTDHIHFSLTWNGAYQRTSWWTGAAATADDRGPCPVYAGGFAPVYTAPRYTACPAPRPAPPAAYRQYVVGQRHPAIAIAQGLLGVAADGVFGMGTRAAVLAFQARESLPRTGVLDAPTWNRLAPVPVPPPSGTTGVPAPGPTPPPTTAPPSSPPRRVIALPEAVTTRYAAYKGMRLRVGSRGMPVRVLQRGLRVPVTGVVDARTRAAVIALQRRWRLPATGTTDLKTWNRVELTQFPWLGYGRAVVRPGSVGAAVAALQQGLRLTVSGRFDGATGRAVRGVQSRYGLPVTGATDPATWRAVGAQGPR